MKKRHLCLLLCMFMLAYCIYATPIRVEHRGPDDQTHLIFSDEDGNIIKEIAVNEKELIELSPSKNYALLVEFHDPQKPPYPYGGWWDPPATQPEPVQQEPQLSPGITVKTKRSDSPLQPEDPQARPAWEEWKHQITTNIAVTYDSTGCIVNKWRVPSFKNFPYWGASYTISDKGKTAVYGSERNVVLLLQGQADFVASPSWLIGYSKHGDTLCKHSFGEAKGKYVQFLSNNTLILVDSAISESNMNHYTVNIFDEHFQEIAFFEKKVPDLNWFIVNDIELSSSGDININCTYNKVRNESKPKMHKCINIRELELKKGLK